MENCPFPIELCEAVIDGTIPWPTHIHRYSPPLAQLTVQRTLYACALTCRAWRTRAQRLLWSYVYLKNAPTAISFASASRIASGECRSLLSTLCIGEELRGTLIDEKHLAVTDLANVNELFMLPFPNLFTLHCTAVRFNLGPGVLRMRLPFFSTGSLNTLVLRLCIFDSARAFLDLVWAFPNLSHLHVVYGKLRREILTPAGAAHLASVGNQLQAGRKLTSVNFHHVRNPDAKLLGSSCWLITTNLVYAVQRLFRRLHRNYAYPECVWSNVDSSDPRILRSRRRTCVCILSGRTKAAHYTSRSCRMHVHSSRGGAFKFPLAYLS